MKILLHFPAEFIPDPFLLSEYNDMAARKALYLLCILCIPSHVILRQRSKRQPDPGAAARNNIAVERYRYIWYK